MREDILYLPRPDGAILRVWRWSPEGMDIKGAVALVLGATTYGRYSRSIGEQLCASGFRVWAADMRNYGSTPPPAPEPDLLEGLLGDLEALISHVEMQEGAQAFLMGAYIGAALAYRREAHALRRSPGLILLSPTICPPMIGRYSDIGRELLARHFPRLYSHSYSARSNELLAQDFPQTPFNFRIPLTHDTEFAALRAADPDLNRNMSSGLTWVVTRVATEWKASARRLRTPTLIVAGSQDGFEDPATVVEFQRLAPRGMVDLRVIEGAYSALHNEIEPYRSQALRAIASWLEARCGP